MTNPLNVSIRIQSEFIDEGGKESIQKEEQGIYIFKNNIHVIKYDEQIDDIGEVKTILMIQKDKVILKRDGVLKMHQVFKIGRKTETLYTHPYGNFRMETTTHRIEFFKGIDQRSGRVYLEYDVSLNEQEERRHILEVHFNEKED